MKLQTCLLIILSFSEAFKSDKLLHYSPSSNIDSKAVLDFLAKICASQNVLFLLDSFKSKDLVSELLSRTFSHRSLDFTAQISSSTKINSTTYLSLAKDISVTVIIRVLTRLVFCIRVESAIELSQKNSIKSSQQSSRVEKIQSSQVKNRVESEKSAELRMNCYNDDIGLSVSTMIALQF